MYETTGYAQSEPQCASDAPSSPVAKEIKGIRQGQDTTSGLIGQLESRLSSVLSGAVPQAGREKAEANVAYSPLHGDLKAAGERQQAINDRLRDLIERLTV